MRQVVKIIIPHPPITIPITTPPQSDAMLISNAHNVTSKIIKTLSISPIDRIRDYIHGQRR